MKSYDERLSSVVKKIEDKKHREEKRRRSLQKGILVTASFLLVAGIAFAVPIGMNIKGPVSPPATTVTGTQQVGDTESLETSLPYESESDTPTERESTNDTENPTEAPTESASTDVPETTNRYPIGGTVDVCTAHPWYYHCTVDELKNCVDSDEYYKWHQIMYEQHESKEYKYGVCPFENGANLKSFIDYFEIPRDVFESLMDVDKYFNDGDGYDVELSEMADILYSGTVDEISEYFNDLECYKQIDELREFMSSYRIRTYHCSVHSEGYHMFLVYLYRSEVLPDSYDDALADAADEYLAWKEELTERWFEELYNDLSKIGMALECRTPYNIKEFIKQYGWTKEDFLKRVAFTDYPIDVDLLFDGSDEEVEQYFINDYESTDGGQYFRDLRHNLNTEYATQLSGLALSERGSNIGSIVEKIYLLSIPRSKIEAMIADVDAEMEWDKLHRRYDYNLDLIYGEGTEGTDALPLPEVGDIIVSLYREYGVSMYEYYGNFTDAVFGKSTVEKYYGITEDTYDEDLFLNYSNSYNGYPSWRLNEMFCRVGRYAE